MKKTGFTLAEILITLAIVGVVSALTIPTFTAQMQLAKVGPKLAKAIASFEQASKAVLDDNNVDRLTMLYSSSSSLNGFLNAMEDHLKGNADGNIYHGQDGVDYRIFDACNYSNTAGLPHRRRVCSTFIIDINGINALPNSDSRDRFYFQLMDDGSLRPWGGSWETNANNRWQTQCQINQRPQNAQFCAGHIIENGLKAEYK